MFKGISVDGTVYNMAVGAQRTARVQSSEISGMLLNKDYFNDVIATYLEYAITVAIPRGQELNYATFYEAITDPVASHTFIFPYNNTTTTVTGRVEVVNDEYVKDTSVGGTAAKLWRRISFNVISNTPIKTPSTAGT